MQKRINMLKNHIIVCGYSQMSKIMVSQLIKQKRSDLVVIEVDQDKIAELEKEGMLFVKGDASEESTLIESGITRASTLVALLPTDSENVFVSLTARELNPDLFIITRAKSVTTEAKLIRAGANRVVCPQIIGAHRVSQLITKPGVVDFVDVAATGVEFEISEYHVTSESSLSGKTLMESGLRQKADAMVVAIHKSEGGTVFNPKADVVVQEGDTLILIGRLHTSDRMAEL